MMPEGLMQTFNDQEVRDLIYYLRSPAQAPLPATAETARPFLTAKISLAGMEISRYGKLRAVKSSAALPSASSTTNS